MPIYEYLCEECGSLSEHLVRSGNQKVECAECGSTKLTRQFSTFAAHGAPSTSGHPCETGACPSAGQGACPSGSCPLGR